jgi:hypothetical protein
MTSLFFVFLLATPWLDGHAQSAQSMCDIAMPQNQWTNCIGGSSGADGQKYVGEFRDGRFHGWGTLTYPDSCDKGLVEILPMSEALPAGWENLKCQTKMLFGKPLFKTYVGQFRSGERFGFGTLYSAKGEIERRGRWESNVFLMSKTEEEFKKEEEVREQERLLALKAEQERQEAEKQRVREELAAAQREKERIEREGDGSEDDKACKSRQLKPSTDAYKKCRTDLVVRREEKLRKAQQLADAREAARLEKIRKDQLVREQQEQARLERQRRAALQEQTVREEEQRRREIEEKDPLFFAKQQCRELGFKEKTEKFGSCVLQLSKSKEFQDNSIEATTARSDGSPDDKTCIGYGYAVGTTGYADCRLKLDQARRDYERDLRAYEAEKAEYDRRAAAIKAENERRAAEALGQYGMCLANCRGDFLTCSSRCGSGAAGTARSIGEPPAQPSGFTTYIINGKIINCNRFGSTVTCN